MNANQVAEGTACARLAVIASTHLARIRADADGASDRRPINKHALERRVIEDAILRDYKHPTND